MLVEFTQDQCGGLVLSARHAGTDHVHVRMAARGEESLDVAFVDADVPKPERVFDEVTVVLLAGDTAHFHLKRQDAGNVVECGTPDVVEARCLEAEAALGDVAPQPVRPALYFYDTEGNPIAAESVVDITGDLEISEDGGLTVLTEMEPLGELTIATHGQGDLVSGSVKVASEGLIGGMLRFDLPGIGEAVVEASLPISDALFPVRRREGGITTGVEIHNLESSPGLVRCDLLREGVLRDAASLPLEANGQTSWLIDQAFPGTDTSDFAGSVRCDAVREGRFSAVALEMDPGSRIFITLPVFPVNRLAGGQGGGAGLCAFRQWGCHDLRSGVRECIHPAELSRAHPSTVFRRRNILRANACSNAAAPRARSVGRRFMPPRTASSIL